MKNTQEVIASYSRLRQEAEAEYRLKLKELSQEFDDGVEEAIKAGIDHVDLYYGTSDSPRRKSTILVEPILRAAFETELRQAGYHLLNTSANMNYLSVYWVAPTTEAPTAV